MVTVDSFRPPVLYLLGTCWAVSCKRYLFINWVLLLYYRCLQTSRPDCLWLVLSRPQNEDQNIYPLSWHLTILVASFLLSSTYKCLRYFMQPIIKWIPYTLIIWAIICFLFFCKVINVCEMKAHVRIFVRNVHISQNMKTEFMSVGSSEKVWTLCWDQNNINWNTDNFLREVRAILTSLSGTGRFFDINGFFLEKFLSCSATDVPCYPYWFLQHFVVQAVSEIYLDDNLHLILYR